MTKKKGIASKLFIGLTGLTLLSCCFLGTTFARYTSGGSGTAEVGVALWNVNFSTDGTATATTTKLSPDDGEYTYNETSTARTNSTDKFLVAAIVNDSDVAANVTIEYNSEAVYTTAASYGTGYTWSDAGVGTDQNPSEEQVDTLFSIELFSNTEADAAGASSFTSLTTQLAAGGGRIYLYAVVTWTSADATSEAFADALDTWVGENITALTYNFKFTAVQASELPPEAGD